MKLKRKKTILLIMLSLILSTSGCKKDESYKKDIHSRVKEIMDDYSFYQDKDSSGKTYEEIFSPFYYNYLEKFIDYMSEEQFYKFLNIVISMNEFEKYDYDTTFGFLDEIMGYEKDKFGRGIYKAFNTRLVYEEIFPAHDFNIEAYHEINTLKSIVNNDEAFFSSLFSKNIDKFIECIQDNTGFTNKDLIQELVLNMDLYSDIEEKEEVTFEELDLKKIYNKRIEDIMSMIVEAKLTSDQKFADTFYGKILKDSKYMKDCYTCGATQELLGDQVEFSVLSEKFQEFYRFTLSKKHIFSNMDISGIKVSKINEIIKLANEEMQNSNAMDLMIHLVSPDKINEASSDYNAIRLVMYEDLKEYFENVEEFNDFFLMANCYKIDVIEDDYFTMFKNRIKENGITIDDFICYLSLVNLINNHNFIYYDWDFDVDYPPIEEITSLPKDEAEKIVDISIINRIFDSENYKTHLEKISEMLKENNLGYEMIYNPECKYEYEYGKIIIDDDSNSVISKLVDPKKGLYNGMNVVYYEIPTYFDDGKAVFTFKNIEDKLTIKELEGFKINFFDEISGKEVNGFIVKIDNKQDETEEYEPIRFIEYYKNFASKRNNKNKELKLGVKQ